jgi:hypothetical protein
VAKRFTDTNKWEKNNFTSLSLKMKLVWIYLCDKCDHAGFWDINIGLMSFLIGESITLDEILQQFGTKVISYGDKLHIPSFLDFQYGELNSNNKVHKSVLNILEKQAPYMGLDSSLQGAKEKEKEKDKAKALDKENAKDKVKKKEKEKIEQNVTQPVRMAYVAAYVGRYKVEPVINARLHAAIKNIVQRLGSKDAIEVVKFYLKHNDGQYIKSTHSIGLLQRDCESLRTQWDRGRPVTNTLVRQFEKSQSTSETINSIRENGI